eukprot:2229394-Ditylum_brightwellii.AAC.1
MTQKAVGNAILQSGIPNYLHATCRANKKGFMSNALDLNKNAQCGKFVCKIDPCLGKVVTRWKDSRVLQTISTLIDS